MLDTPKIIQRLNGMPGKISVWIENTNTSEILCHKPEQPLIAASVIKLSVMLAAFEAFRTGYIKKETLYTVREAEKKPSCGALTYMHNGTLVTMLDLVTLMIILSDNTATNILIDLLGIDYINESAQTYALNGFVLRRKLFDSEASARGLENTVTAEDTACFYRMLMNGKLISPEASKEMLAILSQQRLNGKIPFYLHEHGISVAHKTGEDDGITHDAGIIYAANGPWITVFLSNETSVTRFERFMQDISAEICGIILS